MSKQTAAIKAKINAVKREMSAAEKELRKQKQRLKEVQELENGIQDVSSSHCSIFNNNLYQGTSIGVNKVPFSKIESVEIEKDTSLVTINGSCTFDLYRTVAGQSVRMEESDRKYKKWSSLRFFMAIQEKAAFYQMLQEHRIPIKEM